MRRRQGSIIHNAKTVPVSTLESIDPEVKRHFKHYAGLLHLSLTDVLVTTERTEFETWLGRRVSASLGGAYVFLARMNRHVIVINLPRIDRSKPRAVELVVAEELIHMRDHIDGDHRRHAKHGYDRIALRVAGLTGASLAEIRDCLLPVKRRTLRYRYACPSCGTTFARRQRGIWSCGKCAPKFDHRFVLRLVEDMGTIHPTLHWIEREGDDNRPI